MTSKADRYWEQSRGLMDRDADPPPRYLEAFSFGFTPADASEIAELVLSGIKTATGSLHWSYEADGKNVPQVGDHSIVIDGQQQPVCIIQTVDVSLIPFDEVPEIYALEGGEEDRTLATWRPMYWQYIESECRRINREPSPLAPLVMERFVVVYREALRDG